MWLSRSADQVRKMKLAQLIILSYLTQPTYQSDDEPSIPSHMPAPPKAPLTLGGGQGRPGSNTNGGSGGGGGGVGNLFSGLPPVPPPQNNPVSTPAANAPPAAPFGLDHIILILVPQFKARIQDLPKWMGSNVKFSLPITVFFDKLKFPPPLPPRGPISPFHGPFFPNGHYVKKRHIVQDRTSESESTGRRSSFNSSIYGAERVILIPRLANLLSSFGFEKGCLLRAICEVHEVLKMENDPSAISRSGFADSHLPEYLKAEEFGKFGDCSKYVEACSSSLFYWEKVHSDIIGSEVEAEAELLYQFL